MSQASLSVNLLGVVGAGTMGTGIAQTAIQSGLATVLVDAAPDALARADGAIDGALRKGVERERWTAADADTALARLTLADDTAALARADVVIEAVPERLELKREVLGAVAEACGPEAVLATNTSSLLVSAVAAGVPRPGRVIGMHFFNPVPSMRLVEVVPGADTDDHVVAAARALGARLGKRVVVAQDGIGFLVNRCGRPFIGEALRLLQEGVATVEQIDRICRMGGGFRMGPFELADLVGLDVNLEIAESFWRQSYGETRWKPSPIQARLVAAGRHGRKTHSGFYEYRDGPHRGPDPDARPPGGGRGRVAMIHGSGAVADGLRTRAVRAGFVVAGRRGDGGGDAFLEVDADPRRGAAGRTPRPHLLLCAATSLGDAGDKHAYGFHLVGPVEESRLVETTTLPTTPRDVVTAGDSFFDALGLHVERVGDAPGLVLGRIVAQLVNEAAFAIGERIASPADIDAGTTLGLNYPRGPVAWGHDAGLRHIKAILTGLYETLREERYRTAPMLRAADTTLVL
jgi:3-hydroxybutyryl-CoA dehydrogenase